VSLSCEVLFFKDFPDWVNFSFSYSETIVVVEQVNLSPVYLKPLCFSLCFVLQEMHQLLYAKKHHLKFLKARLVFRKAILLFALGLYPLLNLMMVAIEVAAIDKL
jgi:hypothetical protein